MAGYTMRKVENMSSSIKRNRDLVREVEELHESFRLYDRASEEIGKALSAVGPAREALLAKLGANLRPDDVNPPEKVSLDRGWVALTQQLTFNNVDIRSVMAFVESAERLRPPWRLTSCDVRASSSAAGRGQVVLRLSTVQRAP